MSTTHHSKHRDRDWRTSNESTLWWPWLASTGKSEGHRILVVSCFTVTAHNQKEKNQKAMIIIIGMQIGQVSLIWIQPVIMMVNGMKASIGTVDLIMMIIIIIQIQIQISNLPATGLAIWIEIEIMKMPLRRTKETLHMDVLLDKNTRDFSLGNESNSNDIPPHGSIGKRWKFTDHQSYEKSNAYQGNEKYFDQKCFEKGYTPKHSNERFPGLRWSDHQSYEKSNAYQVNKFTDQKSSEKGYTPRCDDKLPALHRVNEKSPAHHQVNENSPALHDNIQSRLTCDDYHSRDQAVYPQNVRPSFPVFFAMRNLMIVLISKKIFGKFTLQSTRDMSRSTKTRT